MYILFIESYDGEFDEHLKGVYYTCEDAIDAILMNQDIDIEEAREMHGESAMKKGLSKLKKRRSLPKCLQPHRAISTLMNI